MVASRTVVVSAVNFSEGGPLTVLRDCLDAAAACLPPGWRIIALVHRRSLVDLPRVECVDFPQVKASWLRRLWFEWRHSNQLSHAWQPDLWLALHDMTPRVKARRRIVYCHNPAPFYRLSLREAWLEPKLQLFNWLYGALYGVGIRRNHAVVVQQEWLRDAFRRRYGCGNVMVAHPDMPVSQAALTGAPASSHQGKTVFLYPALSRVFKNFEMVCQAVAALTPEEQAGMELRITIDGSENRYARFVVKRFSCCKAIRFIGRQSREAMRREYLACDAVVFPSRLETWGLPITEAKAFGKPLLVAELPYAHETVGTYDRVAFLSVDEAAEWTHAMRQLVGGQPILRVHHASLPAAPYAANWRQLWQWLVEGL